MLDSKLIFLSAIRISFQVTFCRRLTTLSKPKNLEE